MGRMTTPRPTPAPIKKIELALKTFQANLEKLVTQVPCYCVHMNTIAIPCQMSTVRDQSGSDHPVYGVFGQNVPLCATPFYRYFPESKLPRDVPESKCRL